MKILFDHQIFEMQNVGGISRYFTELLKQYSKNCYVDWILPIKYSQNEHLDDIQATQNRIQTPEEAFKEFFWGIEFPGKWTLYNYKKIIFPEKEIIQINKELSIAYIQKGDFDIFHPTYYDNYFLKYIKDKPYVLTVHDMVHEIFPEYFKLSDPVPIWKKALLQNAKKIISVSETTRQDIIDIYGINKNQIKVIYHGSSLNKYEADSIKIQHELPERYLLFIGKRRGYKNFYFLIYSINKILKSDKNLYMVCIGSDFTKEEKIFINNLGIKEKILHYHIKDNELEYLYKNALAFVFPSLYEGFGIPVLEAFSCGCPVILSNYSSLPEVAGDAAIYFDPKNIKSINRAISSVLYDEKLRINLKIKGFAQIKKFSWQKAGEETIKVYEEILNG